MIVIGAGRIGMSLQRAAQENGEDCTLVTRTDGWDAVDGPPGDPILITTRNDDLPDVLARIPKERHDDLVFIQNGMLGPWLQEQGLTRCTRGLLFFAANHRGGPIEPGPEPSPFTGPHGLTVVRWMVRCGARAQVVDWPRFSAWELEKLVWNSAFGLLCHALDADVGTVCDDHAERLRALVAELRVVGRASLNVDLPEDWLLERLVAYSRSIPTTRASFKEWRWRNGWFVAEAHRLGVPTPTHHALLVQVGFGDRLP